MEEKAYKIDVRFVIRLEGNRLKVNFILPPAICKASGGYKVVYQYANHMVSQGCDVMIYYDARNGENSSGIPKVVAICMRSIIAMFEPRWFRLNPKVKKRSIKNIKKRYMRDADIIIATAIDTAIKIYNLDYPKDSLVHFVQDHENCFLGDNIVNEVYRYPIYKIAVSNWLAEKIRQENRNVSVVKNGIDTTRFFPDQANPREKFSVAMMYVPDNQRKNSEMGLSVLNFLKERYPKLKAYFYSSYPKPDSLPEWIDYRQNAKEDEIRVILNKSSVFLCTSNQEGYGLPGLEAMACGCVLVSTECKGILEYAEDGYNSMISPVGNAELMAKNVISLFDDSELRVKLSKQGIETAYKLDLDGQARKFEELVRRHMENYERGHMNE